MMGSGVSRCDQRGGTKWESIRLNVDQHKVSLEHLKRQSESAVCAEKPCNFTSFNANDKSTADIRAVPQALQTSTPTTDAKLSPARCSLKLNIARQQKESTVLQRSLNCTGTRFESMVDPLYLNNAAVLSSEHKSNYSFSTDCNHNSKHNSHSDVSDSKSSICSSSRVIYCTIGSILGPDDDKSDAKYIKKQLIGKGAFGEAYIVERNARYNVARHAAISEQCQVNTSTRPTIVGNRYVAKVIDLNNMPSQHRQYAQTEIICLAQVHHFAIVGYYEHYILDSEEDTIIIITEFADHGDLHHNLTQPTNACCPAPYIDKTSGRLVQGFRRLQLTEREAGIYFIQLLMALHYIHSHRMIHRDVKSANLFLTSRGLMKLGDFGFSQCYESTVSSESVAGTFLGTPYYLSPEMWSGTRYGKKADVWAAGIVLYEMLMDGARPFRAESLPELRRNVESNKVTLPECPPPLSDPVLWKRDDLVSHPPSHDTGNNATTNNTMNSNDGKTGNSSDETNARIRANTDWAVNSGDGGGSTISADVSSDGANALPRPRRVTNRARKFSEEMREFVSSIFERDPSCRPNTIKLLRTPIMQYYLHLFEKHIHSLIEADEQKLMQCKSFESATSGVQACGVGLHGSITDAAAAGLNFPCSSEKDLILSDINEVKLAVAHEMTKDLSAGIAQCYEGVVYKQNHNGEWKERYLALTDGALIISLVSGRQAIRGTERSRKVPLSMINAVSPCDPVGSIVRVCQHSTTISRAPSQQSAAAIEDKAMRSSVSSVPALAFAISMHSENSIVFGVSSVVELDCWLSTLLLALNME